MFALMLIPLLLLSGGVVDYIRYVQARSAAQAALDAAALAAARLPLTNPADVTTSLPAVQAEARKYMTENVRQIRDLDSIDAVVANYVADAVTARHRIVLSTTARVNTAFLRIIGIRTINIGLLSETMRPTVGPVQMALVVDVSDSMKTTTTGGVTRLGALQLAATDLANEVLSPSNPEASMGIVSFAEYVNLGPSYRTSRPSWLAIPPDRSSCPQSCVIDTTRTCYNEMGARVDCLNCTVPATCADAVKVTTTFLGCVSPRRTSAERTTIAMVAPVAGLYPGNRKNCGGPGNANNVVLPLTKSNTEVTTYIAGRLLVSGSRTYMPIGLIWAWNLLNPDQPIGQSSSGLPRTAADLADVNGRNVVVIMSDGENTAVPWGDSDDTVGTPRPPPIASPTIADSNAETRTICNAMREERFEIFTVLFDETTTAANKAASTSILKDCAGQLDRFYIASDTASLRAAFKDIALRLSKLTVVR